MARPPPSNAALWQLDAVPGACVAATFALDGDIAPGGGVVVQVTYTQRLACGGWRARATTRRIPATTDDDAFVAAVNAEAAAALVAKEAASLAKANELAGGGGVLMEGGREAVEARLGAKVEALATALGTPMTAPADTEEGGGWLASLMSTLAPPSARRVRAIPAPLVPIAEVAYRIANAREFGGAEHSAARRRLVLRAGPALACAVAAPVAHVRGAGSFEFALAPAPTLAPGVASVVDAGTEFFVWTGSEDPAAAVKFAEGLAKGRWPAAPVQVATEGSALEAALLAFAGDGSAGFRAWLAHRGASVGAPSPSLTRSPPPLSSGLLPPLPRVGSGPAPPPSIPMEAPGLVAPPSAAHV